VYKVNYDDGGYAHGIFDNAAKAEKAGRLYCRQWETTYSFRNVEFVESVEANGRTDKEILSNYDVR
jgi:hypothetical protein